MKRTKLPELAVIAEDQWGMVSTAQAVAAGISPHTLSQFATRGLLERLSHGVYRLTGVPPSPDDDLRVAWIGLDPRRTAADRIATGPTEVVSHRSAAAVHGIGDLIADRLEFTTTVRRQTRRRDVRIHRGRIDSRDWTLADGLPITTALRAIEDLVEERLDRGHLAGMVRDALVRQLASLGELSTALTPHARHYGVPAKDGDRLGVLLDEAGVPQSTMEMAERASVLNRQRRSGSDSGGLQ